MKFINEQGRLLLEELPAHLQNIEKVSPSGKRARHLAILPYLALIQLK